MSDKEKPEYTLPKEIFARCDENCDGVVLAETDVSKFDSEGSVGRYVLAETGRVTIDTAFLPDGGKVVASVPPRGGVALKDTPTCE